jgi:uncharacterized membrane protein (DUF485 family)
VSTLWAQGQFDASRKAADDAKKFAMWAAIAGVIVIVLYVIFVVLIGIGANSS